MRVLILGLLILCLAGCFNKVRTPFTNPHPFYGYRVPTEPSGMQGIAIDKAKIWTDAHQAIKDNRTPTKDELMHYVGAGMTYSQLICRDYFERLALTKSHRSYTRQELNLTNGLVSSLLGLASASSGVVAGSSALFSFGGASIDAYDEAYLVSPNIAELERLVLVEQDRLEAEIYHKINRTDGDYSQRILSVHQADRALNQYIFKCTANGIRNLVSQSLNEKAAGANDAGVVETKPPQ